MTSRLENSDVLCYIFLHNQELGVRVLKKAKIKIDEKIPQPYGARDFDSEYANLQRFCKEVTEMAIKNLEKQEVMPSEKEAYGTPFQKGAEESPREKAYRLFKDFLECDCKKLPL